MNARDRAHPQNLVEHTSQRCLWVDPFRCRMWAMHDRCEETLNERSCRGEIESFLRHGQLVPALGRPLRDDPEYDVELIYGARRLFVARHVNRALAVKLQELSDREAFIAMDIENRHRQDLCPYERGRSYAKWLRSGNFGSQDELARELQISAAQVSRLLKIARLPSVIINAFASPVDIPERWGLELAEAWDDPARRTPMAALARGISQRTSRPAARAVYEALLASATPRPRTAKPRVDTVITCERGKPLFRLRRRRNCILLLLPPGVAPAVLDELTGNVAQILQRASMQAADVTNENVTTK